MKAKLTQTYLANVMRPDEGTTRIMDADLQGFGVDVGKQRVTFFVRRGVGGAKKKIKVGEWPLLTVSQAREVARSMLSEMAAGRVPDQAARKGDETYQSLPTFSEAREAYITFRSTTGRRYKDSTIVDMRQRLGHVRDWDSRPFNEIGRAEISERHAKITQTSGPYAANGCMRYVSAVLNWASEEYGDDEAPVLVVNPVRVLARKRQWNVEKRRQTFVRSSDLPALWKAIYSMPDLAERWSGQGEIVRDWCVHMLFTGMRPGEAQRLRCDRVRLDDRIFCLEDSKTHNDFHLPFAKALVPMYARRIEYSSLVGSPYLFPALGHHGEAETVRYREHFARVREQVPMIPGDFRRTFMTIIGNLQPAISDKVQKRLLNHKTEEVDPSDVTAGYFAGDVERLREVVDRIAKEIFRLAKVKASKV